MKGQHILAVMLICIMSLLDACGTGLVTKQLHTGKIQTLYTQPSRSSANNWACGTVCFHTHSSGCGTVPTGPHVDEAFVGFSNYYDPGTQPCACWFWKACAYRISAVFDLNAISGKKIFAATFQFDNQELEQQWNIGGSGVAISNVPTCIGDVHIAAAAPAPEQGIYTPLADNQFVPVTPSSFTLSPHAAGRRYRAPVSGIVRDWNEGKFPNYGFIITGINEALESESNHRCYGKADNFILEVQYWE